MAKRFPNMMPSSGEWSKPSLARWCKDGLGAVGQALASTTRAYSILLCATCDPYQPTARPITQAILAELLAYHQGGGHYPHQVIILTKSDKVMEDIDLLKLLSAWVGFTITSLGDITRTFYNFEPLAPTNTERIKALDQVRGAGLRTFVSIEPWLPQLSATYIIDLLGQTTADRYIIGSLNQRGQPVNPAFYRQELPLLRAWLNTQGLVEETGQGTGTYYIKPELRRLEVVK